MTADGRAAGLRTIVAAEQERFQVPGCAVLVVAGGEVVLAEGFGVRDRDRGLPVTPRTLFPIASATKTVTAALCALQVDRGVLHWDRPMRGQLPGFRLQDPVASAEATLRDLLCHRSGLPRHDLLWYAGRDSLAPEEMVDAVGDLPPSRGFRERFQYQNMLYAVAGQAGAGGGSYAEAVRHQLLDPLGMARTTFQVDGAAADPDAARGYAEPAPGEPLAEVPYAHLDPILAAGGLNSCLADLARWLLTLLGHGVDGLPPLLSEAARTALRTPQIPLPERTLMAIGRPVGYGLGMMIEERRGYQVAHHGGNIDGFSSQVSILPEAGYGVAVLCNRASTMLRDALPYLIYDRLLGLPPEPLGAELFQAEQAILAGRSQSRAVPAGNGLPPVRPLADYLGRYRHPGYGDLEVRATDGGGLSGWYRGLSGPLRHRHLEVFDFLVDLTVAETPLTVQFHHDPDGEVSAATAALEPAVPPVRFDRVPETGHLTDAVLDRLAGEYRRGPVTASVVRRGPTGLVALLVEGDYQELTPVRGLVFRTPAGGRVAFAEDGRLLTPAGEFHPAG